MKNEDVGKLQVLPAERLVDIGYVSSDVLVTMVTSAKLGIELVGAGTSGFELARP